MKPKVFIASSSYQSSELQAIAAGLAEVAEPSPWIDGQSELGVNLLDWVATKAAECSFGVFVFGRDPRWQNQVNGNVLFEYGVFVGRHGAGRCFIVNSEQVEVPVDLAGITTARYSTEAFEQDGRGALDGAVNKIKQSMRLHAGLADEIQGLWLETKQVGPDGRSYILEGRYSILEFSLKNGELKVRGRSYDDAGEARIEWPRHLNHCLIDADMSEVYHTFDAQYGPGRPYSALGVSVFSFNAERTAGDGYFVVYGTGGIKPGAIEFTLARVTSDYLQRRGLPADLTFENLDACATLIRLAGNSTPMNGTAAAK
jgi:hypothetical protein